MKITEALRTLHIHIPENFLTEEIFRVSSETKSERLIETPLVLKNIPNRKSVILDVGCRYSLLPIQLASLGHQVHGIDLKNYRRTHPNLHFYKRSIHQTLFRDNFFDVAISLSTIEHIGLDIYGGNLANTGDVKAVKEIKRVLKKNGSYLLTAPFGLPRDSDWYRVYNTKRLERMLTGFLIKEIRVFKEEDKKWVPCEISEGETINSSQRVKCAFFLKAVKKS